MDHPPRTRPRTNVDGDVQWSLLPEEVMEEVHLWLPVKSILKFKCVCKSWLSRFSSLDFINAHLECSKRRNDLDNVKLVFESQFFNFMQSCSLSSVFNEHTALATDLDYVTDESKLDAMIGTCNGLLCAKCCDEESLIVLNPSTRVFRELPLREFWEDEYEANPEVFGFGYDQSSDDYKVVAIGFDTACGVFSMKKNSWRMMDFEIDCKIDDCDLGCFFDGTLNWAVDLENGTDGSWVVLSFDLASEEFQTLPLPQLSQLHTKCGPVVGVLGGCLCVVRHKDDQTNDVWVMKEYGVESSWTLLTSIPYPHDVEFDWFLTPICIFKDIILVAEGDKEKLVLYDLKKKSFYYPQIHGLHGSHEVQLYVESLVSPHGNGEKFEELQEEVEEEVEEEAEEEVEEEVQEEVEEEVQEEGSSRVEEV